MTWVQVHILVLFFLPKVSFIFLAQETGREYEVSEVSEFSIALPSASTEGLTGGLLVKLGVEEEDDGVGVALRRNLPFHLWWSLTPSRLAMLIWPESITTGYWCCSRL